jgi:hypothetical protein
LYSIDINLIRKFTLEQDEKNFLIAPGTFFVTEDSMIFVIDWKGSNIKIYDAEGKMANVFGRRGVGPDEFIMPFPSTYHKPFLAIGDRGRKRFFIYKRIGKSGLELAKCCLNQDRAEDMIFMNDGRLLIVGPKLDKNGKWQNLYIYDCASNKSDFLLSHAITYGYQSESDFQKDFFDDLQYLSGHQYLDLVGDTLYQNWSGNIKINKINIKSSQVTSFGKKTGNYIQPSVTPVLKRAYMEHQSKEIIGIMSKMSYVMDLFIINSKIVALGYVTPLKKNNGLNVMLQFYTVSGEFIKEVELLLNSQAPTLYDLRFYYKKDDNL